MATCKDCVYYPVCNYKMWCDLFKDKADFAEVIHGKWIVNAWDGQDWKIIPYKQGRHTDPFCSRCKEPAMRGARSGCYEISKYCPNCGAKMDGGDE